MAAKDSFAGRHLGYGEKFTFLRNYDKGSFRATLRGLLEPVPGPQTLSSKIEDLASRFACDFARIATHLGKLETQSSFYEACKKRFNDLTVLNGVICTDAKDLDEVNVFVELADGPRQFSGRWDRRHHVYGLASDDSLYDLWSISERPGCYRWLFLAMLVVISWAAEQSMLEPEYKDTAWSIAAWYSTVICSIGRLYEDIRPTRAYVIDCEEKFLSRMISTHDLDHENEWWNTFQEVVRDIRQGTLPYVRDISSAMKRADLLGNRLFTYKDYHVSMRKTGSRYGRRSYPAIYSALYESDLITDKVQAFDDYTGYVSHYNKEPLPDSYEPRNSAISIEQNKPDRRGIRLALNPEQDRCNYVHRRVQSVLDFLPEDCTRDQNRGIEFAKRCTSESYRKARSNNVYSLDISKATDTIDREFQEICLRILLPSEIVDCWVELTSRQGTFRFTGGKSVDFIQTCGQPQGFKSSFPSFAWCHHIIMRMLMHRHHLDNVNARDFYRVLGDDSIISCYDPNEEILDSYIDVCQWINWSTNRSKGFVALKDDIYAFAEFAKKRVLNGVINTPIPSKLILNSEKSANGTIGLFQWISQNYRPLSIMDVWRWSPKLQSMYSEAEMQQILWVAKSGVLPCFEGWKEDVEADASSYSNSELIVITMSYFLTKLRSTLIDQFLPDNLRDVTLGGFDESKLSWLMGTTDEEVLFDTAQDPENKYYQILQMNSDMIDYINHVLYSDREEPSSVAWCSLSLGLTAEEENRIFRCLEICEYFSQGTLPYDAETAFKNLEEANKILTRFNPRGDSRVTFLNGTMWTPVLTKLSSLLSMNFIIPEREADSYTIY